MTYASWVVAFTLGLFSTVHCLGMCGGISSALGIGLPERIRQQASPLFTIVSAYNLGRISSYAIAGALTGAFGYFLLPAGAHAGGHLLLQIGAGVILVLLGLHIGGWLPRLSLIEGVGMRLWHIIQPVGRHFLPLDSFLKALIIGSIWGWLPCGLVYSVLLWSLSSGDPVTGFLTMLAFGLGTLPGMITAGMAVGTIQNILRKPYIRKSFGIVIICFGVVSPLLQGGPPGHADSHQQQHINSTD